MDVAQIHGYAADGHVKLYNVVAAHCDFLGAEQCFGFSKCEGRQLYLAGHAVVQPAVRIDEVVGNP